MWVRISGGNRSSRRRGELSGESDEGDDVSQWLKVCFCDVDGSIVGRWDRDSEDRRQAAVKPQDEVGW